MALEGSPYLGAAFVPIALERTSGHLGSRRSAFGSALLDCRVDHVGSLPFQRVRWSVTVGNGDGDEADRRTALGPAVAGGGRQVLGGLSG